MQPILVRQNTYDHGNPGIRPIGEQSAVPVNNPIDCALSTQFARCINEASANLYAKLSAKRSLEHKNLVFFTPNLLALLSMLMAGAQGDAKVALESFFSVKSYAGPFHASFGQWIDNLSSRSVAMAQELEKSAKEGRYFFKQSQAVMTRHDVTIPLEAAVKLSRYRPVQITFNDNDEAKEVTNKWVEKQTEGKITNLVETLPDETVLLLVTAALFQGSWKYPFKEKKNSVETFYNSDGTKVQCTIMNQGIDDLRLYSDWKKGVKICELPFHGDLSLLVVSCGERWCRDGSKSASNLAKFMTTENILDAIENFDERAQKAEALSIGIPKVDVQDKTDLFKELASEPMVQAILSSNWTGSLVDCPKPTSTKELVSEVKFQMDEAGAQIAAAAYSPTGMESCDPEFKVNSAFGVILMDNKTKTILGMGQFLKFNGPEPKNDDW